ncbi:hypothetical protein [Mucilaginibacter glaciei]|uniref:DUF3168 domain-containing protein n=1 Tax=Mucilaginibacter glaciei TaxID=2772109 RepID=A0A926NLG6_9SPHI|nr:hypothetical protein [Mucilaginibacter glaciei]MBD1394274.1 hypothetical protein [Mucilaginibacter glaciei]
MKIPFLTTQQLLNELNLFSWIAEDNGELDEYETKPSVPPNCALITINVISTQDISDTRQMVKVAIVIRYWYSLAKTETSNKAPVEAVMRSLAYNDVPDAVYKKLQGYADDELDTFSRQSDVKETRRDSLQVRRMTYTTSYLDLGAEE